MLLTIDVGNTTTEFGVFDGEKLVLRWRIAAHVRTSDELVLIVTNHCNGGGVSPAKLTDCAICSVVPPLTPGFLEMARQMFGRNALVVDSSVKTGLTISYRDPLSIGADRIATAVGAVRLFGSPVVIVDMGTATTFEVVSASGEYLGGAIAPGVGASAEELFRRAARLSRVELKRPPSVIGKSTEESLQAGIVLGAASLVDGILTRIFEELGSKPTVVATGGFAALVVPHCANVNRVEDGLVLRGLLAIHGMNDTGRDK
jgi:type III pantothenate kinase